ncbi:MAG: hypothetical protein NT088_03385 [Candidatus Omnitrophica bacterium]|nr:hypothetical protein [Candidatus Omnitrophota bacterium]
MKKSAVIFMLGVAVLFLASFSLAQTTDEQLTFTTYYPSPYGSYNQLQTNALAVGSTTAMPTLDGTANVVRLQSRLIISGLNNWNLTNLAEGTIVAVKFIARGTSEFMPDGVPVE